MIGRRNAIIGIGGAALLALPAMRGADPDRATRAAALAGIERESGGRMGVAVHDLQDGFRWSWRGNERFAMCSTFKLLLAAAILHAAESGAIDLDRHLPIHPGDIVPHAPVTLPAVGGTLSVIALCEAIVTVSDNPAANLLIALLGGTRAVNAFVRRLGDRTTRLDRIEPMLNQAAPGDPRDTTTPDAMVGTMEAMLIGRDRGLGPPARARLIGWMVASGTGRERLRAGAPADWRAGDKTGSGGNGSFNDLAILWPPRRRPILIACYLTETDTGVDSANAAHRAVARAIAART